jgi:flagellar hook-basal body complex protein FliE
MPGLIIPKTSPIMSAPDITDSNVPNSSNKGFGDVLKGLVEETNGLQRNAGELQEKFLLGQVQDLHSVMVAVEEASIAFNLVMEIRNKLLESYQTLLRMPV